MVKQLESHVTAARFMVWKREWAAISAEHLAFDGEPASPTVVEEYSFLSEPLLEYLILKEEVFDGTPLPAIEPAREDEERQVPWLKLQFLAPPGRRFGSGGSGIVGSLSRVAMSVTSAQGKTRCHNRLPLG